jgi:DNA polymerase-4
MLKARYADFQQVTRNRTGELPPAMLAAIETTAYSLLASPVTLREGIRRRGVTLSLLENETGSEHQLRLPI